MSPESRGSPKGPRAGRGQWLGTGCTHDPLLGEGDMPKSSARQSKAPGGMGPGRPPPGRLGWVTGGRAGGSGSQGREQPEAPLSGLREEEAEEDPLSLCTQAARQRGTSCTGYGIGYKQPQPSRTPEVGAACHHYGSREQAPPVAPVTLWGATREGPETKSHPPPSPPWERTHPAIATAKGSGHHHPAMGPHQVATGAICRHHPWPPPPWKHWLYTCMCPIRGTLSP